MSSPTRKRPASEDAVAESSKRLRVVNDSPAQTRDKKKRKKKKRKVSVVDPRPIEAPVSYPSSGHRQPKSEQPIPATRSRAQSAQAEQPEMTFEPVPLPPEASQSSVKEETESENQLLERHIGALANVQQGLTCQVCLDLLHHPYALSPCGHVTCRGCLVQWFKSQPEGAPHSRNKTCPHCRVVVRERPVEVWVIKSVVAGLVKSGLLDNYTPLTQEAEESMNQDPWHGIFPKPRAQYAGGGQPGVLDEFPAEEVGMQDAEDGGIYRCLDCMHEIWNGYCTGCDREYPGHAYMPMSDEEIDNEAIAGFLPFPTYLDLTDETDEDDDDDEDLVIRDFIVEDDDLSVDSDTEEMVYPPLRLRTASQSLLSGSDEDYMSEVEVLHRVGSRGRVREIELLGSDEGSEDDDEEEEGSDIEIVAIHRRPRRGLYLSEDEHSESDVD